MMANATQQPQPGEHHDALYDTINEINPSPLNETGTDHVSLNGHDHDTRPSSPGNPTNQRPIAICGMALRLPNGIKDLEAFWDVLINGHDLQAPVPSTRWNAAGFTNKLGSRSSIAAQRGYFLSDDLSTLDTSFFTMSKRELERCDPQQRKLLELTREVLESAGETEFRGKPIGCYVGTFGEDWLQMSGKEDQHIGGYPLAAYGDLILANRISFEYDLKGPRSVHVCHYMSLQLTDILQHGHQDWLFGLPCWLTRGLPSHPEWGLLLCHRCRGQLGHGSYPYVGHGWRGHALARWLLQDVRCLSQRLCSW